MESVSLVSVPSLPFQSTINKIRQNKQLVSGAGNHSHTLVNDRCVLKNTLLGDAAT